MTTQPPPPRYRVVEQGRRLVVIDTLSGEPVVRSVAEANAPSPKLPSAPKRTDFGGRSTLVTHPIYDDRAPRTLELDEAGTQMVELVRTLAIGGAVALVVAAVFLPWLIVVPALLISPKTRAALRGPVTAWLDRFDTGRAG